MQVARSILVCVLAASPVLAQQTDARPPRGTASLVIAGTLGGAAGFVAGGLTLGVGLSLVGPPTDDDIWTPGLAIGFETGQAVAIPIAVHLVNRRRGNLKRSLLVSLGVGLLGTAVLWTGDFDALFESPTRATALIAIPVAQIVSSILIERRTSRGR